MTEHVSLNYATFDTNEMGYGMFHWKQCIYHFRFLIYFFVKSSGKKKFNYIYYKQSINIYKIPCIFRQNLLPMEKYIIQCYERYVLSVRHYNVRTYWNISLIVCQIWRTCACILYTLHRYILYRVLISLLTGC